MYSDRSSKVQPSSVSYTSNEIPSTPSISSSELLYSVIFRHAVSKSQSLGIPKIGPNTSLTSINES